MKAKGKRTGWTKTEIENEILSRMNALDTLYEEYSNLQLLKDLKESYKRSGKA